jgi:hypothetical protein
LRASFATIASSQGRSGAPRRKRGSARQAFVSPIWAASSASALRVIRYAVRKAISWCCGQARRRRWRHRPCTLDELVLCRWSAHHSPLYTGDGVGSGTSGADRG